MQKLPADQHQILRRADRAGSAADRFLRERWSEVLRLLESPPDNWGQAYHRAREIFASISGVSQTIAQDLAEQADHARKHTVKQLATSLPVVDIRAHEDDDDPDPISYILRPLARNVVDRIVFGSNWAGRFNQLTKLATPESLAGILANGIANGLQPRQIAAQLRPVVQGVQSSARRIARTEGMRVAHEVQIQTWEQIPELISAYQIHATLDENTRPEHRARDGTIYYRRPGPGQKGFDEMPRPPIEADGTVAHNCRCFLTPIIDTEAVQSLRRQA